MSKSKQHSNRATQALRRQRRSLPKKVLDIERHFIDDLMTRVKCDCDQRRSRDPRGGTDFVVLHQQSISSFIEYDPQNQHEYW